MVIEYSVTGLRGFVGDHREVSSATTTGGARFSMRYRLAFPVLEALVFALLGIPGRSGRG